MTVFQPHPLSYPFHVPDEFRVSSETDLAAKLNAHTKVAQLSPYDDPIWLIAFHFLRNYSHQLSPEADQKLRDDSIFGSVFDRYCGRLIKIKEIYDRFADLNKCEATQHFLKVFTKDSANTVSMKQRLAHLRSPQLDLLDFIPEFLGQGEYGNLFDYIQSYCQSNAMDIHLEVLDMYRTDPEVMFKKFQKANPNFYRNYTWEKLPEPTKHQCIAQFIKPLASIHFNLRVPYWHPSDPIGALEVCLATHGPLLVAGRFGIKSYQTPPQKLTRGGKVVKVENKNVYFWPKRSPQDSSVSPQRIILRGIKTSFKTSLVFYIHAKKVDVQHLGVQSLFVMSYERLTSAQHICDHFGIIGNTAPREVGYIFYGDKRINPRKVEEKTTGLKEKVEEKSSTPAGRAKELLEALAERQLKAESQSQSQS